MGSKAQVGSGSSQAKARQRGNTLQRSPALDQGIAMSDGTRNTPGRTLPRAPSLPCEPLSPEPPSASMKGCADPAGGSSEVAAHSQAAGGGAYTTVWMPVAVNVRPLSWTMGSTRLWGLWLVWNWLKVKWVFRRFEYWIRENCEGQEEDPGAWELFFRKFFILE